MATRRTRLKLLVVAVAAAVITLAAVTAGLAWQVLRRPGAPAPVPAAAPASPLAADEPLKAALALLRAQLDTHRRLVVLFADEATLSAVEREAASRVGQQLFHEQLARQAEADRLLATLAQRSGAARDAALQALLEHIESGEGLFDADRLAFQESLRTLQAALKGDGALPAVKLHQRVSEDLDALRVIEQAYDREIRQIYSRFEARAIPLKREKWADYLAHLKTLYRREQILKDQGVVVPYPPQPEASVPEPPAAAADDGGREIFGHQLPPRTVVLSFDDGPHRQYTPEVEAMLRQYGVPAVFFQVGRNLGQVQDGRARLDAGGRVAMQLQAGGFTLANHSYSHAQLSKRSGEALKAEILDTDLLLKAVSPQRAPLFRFPYGARNAEGLAALKSAQLRSVMWNVDSLAAARRRAAISCATTHAASAAR